MKPSNKMFGYTVKGMVQQLINEHLNVGKGITTSYLAGENAIITCNWMMKLCNESNLSSEYFYWFDVKSHLETLLNYKK